jgi:HEAT repeat protein
MRDAVLRLGGTLDQVEPYFAKLDLDDRVALGLAVLESERFAKFTPDLSTAALKAVGLRKDVRYLPQLVKGTSHPVWQVRIQAASSIGNTFAREAGAPLIEMLRDDDPNVRDAAQNALNQIANYLDARAQWEQRFK